MTGGVTGPTTATAPTTGSPAQRVAAKAGVIMGAPQGAGSSWRTTGPVLPPVGVANGPEPQNRNSRSCRLADTTASPRIRFSAKMNSKFGAWYWPAIRPLAGSGSGMTTLPSVQA